MYRAYKRTEIASYVRYTCFKVAVNFFGRGISRNHTVLRFELSQYSYTPVKFSPFTETKNTGNDTETRQ